MSSPSLATIKKLFAKSGDRCAFPQCPMHVVEGNTIVADVCHICAASPLGPRYNPKQTDTERHAFENLILLCAVHHRIVDDDPGKYTVAGLMQMKRAHEANATALASDTVDRTAVLLAEKATSEEPPEPMSSISSPDVVPAIDPAKKQSLIARAAAHHRARSAQIASNAGIIPDLGEGRFIFHLVPTPSLDLSQSPGFSELCRNPDWFPPIAGSAQDWNVDFDGFLIGSNGDGLRKPQRAYVYITRAGIVEAVASSLGHGYDSDLIMLPHVQAMLIKYVLIYMNSLNKVGITPPTVVCASLTSVNKMRLLQDFIANAIPEDIPGPRLNRDLYSFAETWLDAVPTSVPDAARRLKPTLDHMANAAGLTVSPYFDRNGDYTLKP